MYSRLREERARPMAPHQRPPKIRRLDSSHDWHRPPEAGILTMATFALFDLERDANDTPRAFWSAAQEISSTDGSDAKLDSIVLTMLVCDHERIHLRPCVAVCPCR